DGAGDARDRGAGSGDQLEDYTSTGQRRRGAASAESVRRHRDRYEAFALRSAAMADSSGYLVLLVLGRAVPDGPAAVRQRDAEGFRSTGGADGDVPGGGDRRGEHAGGEAVGRQGG